MTVDLQVLAGVIESRKLHITVRDLFVLYRLIRLNLKSRNPLWCGYEHISPTKPHPPRLNSPVAGVKIVTASVTRPSIAIELAVSH